MLALKAIGVLAVFAVGLVGGVVPLRARDEAGRGRLLAWGNALAAGVFLGAGLIHLLPEADEAWRALGWSYPVAFLLAAAAFLAMLLFEHVLLPEGAHEALHTPAGDRFSRMGAAATSGIEPYAILAALSLHSFLTGTALGSQQHVAGALVLFVAIMAHKSTAGFALGVSLARSGMRRSHAYGLLAFFAAATPLGIVAGIVLGQSLQVRPQRVAEAALTAMAGGTFVYVATLDILREELVGPGSLWMKWLLVSAGTAAMAALALWL